MKKSKTTKTTLMVHNDRDMLIGVMESYPTICRRLMEVGDFFEATTTQGKEVFAKKTIVRVTKMSPLHVPLNNIGTTEPQ